MGIPSRVSGYVMVPWRAECQLKAPIRVARFQTGVMEPVKTGDDGHREPHCRILSAASTPYARFIYMDRYKTPIPRSNVNPFQLTSYTAGKIPAIIRCIRRELEALGSIIDMIHFILLYICG